MLNDPLLSVLSQKLLESAVTQKVISNNLANSETPNYKSFRVVFDQAASNVSGDGPVLPLVRTNPLHLGGAGAYSDLAAATGARLVRDTGSTLRNDGNNVDVDRELADLSANTLYYGALTTFIKNRFDGYRRIIAGNH